MIAVKIQGGIIPPQKRNWCEFTSSECETKYPGSDKLLRLEMEIKSILRQLFAKAGQGKIDT